MLKGLACAYNASPPCFYVLLRTSTYFCLLLLTSAYFCLLLLTSTQFCFIIIPLRASACQRGGPCKVCAPRSRREDLSNCHVRLHTLAAYVVEFGPLRGRHEGSMQHKFARTGCPLPEVVSRWGGGGLLLRARRERHR
eukprot:1109760-Pleurochrysis_carterae.AAC.2